MGKQGVKAVLTKLQAALLADMVAGVRVYYIPYRGRFGDRYYFREDSHKKVTRAVDRLIELGFAEAERRSAFRIDGARP